MRYLFLNILFLCINILAFAQQKGGSVNIHVKGWGNDTICIMKTVWGSNLQTFDFIRATNGRISYQTSPEDTTELIFASERSVIYPPNRKYFIFPEACAIETLVIPGVSEEVSGELYPRKLLFTSSGTGMDYHQDAAREHTLLVDLKWQIDSINRKIEFAKIDKLKAQQKNELFAHREKIESQIKEMQKAALLANPQAQLSGKNLTQLSYEDIVALAPSLSSEVRNGLFKSQIDNYLATAKEYIAAQQPQIKIEKGYPAPDFTLQDPSGISHKLSDFQGKWVVLDFWGSWCGWCTEGFPDMKTAYQKHQMDVEFIGIACRDTKGTWLAALAKYKLPWIQFLDETPDDVSTEYAVSMFPTKIIIDPHGMIREVTHGENPKFYKLLDQLISSDK